MTHALSDEKALGIEYRSLADEIRDTGIVSPAAETAEAVRADAAASLREARTLLQILSDKRWVFERPSLQLAPELLNDLVARVYSVTFPNGAWGVGTLIDLLESQDALPEKALHQTASAIEIAGDLFHELSLMYAGEVRAEAFATIRGFGSHLHPEVFDSADEQDAEACRLFMFFFNSADTIDELEAGIRRVAGDSMGPIGPAGVAATAQLLLDKWQSLDRLLEISQRLEQRRKELGVNEVFGSWDLFAKRPRSFAEAAFNLLYKLAGPTAAPEAQPHQDPPK